MNELREKILSLLKDKGFDNWWDYIDTETQQEIESEIDELIQFQPINKELDGWISVKDRLPEDEEDYLCSFIGWDDMEFQRVMCYDKYEKVWYGWETTEYNTVTHWMPLPNPPKK